MLNSSNNVSTDTYARSIERGREAPKTLYYSYPLSLCSDCVPGCRCATVRLTTDQYSPVPPAHLLQVSHFPATHHVPVFRSSLSLRSIALSIFFPENLRFRGAICPSLGEMTLGLVISFATKMACFPTRNERNLFSPHFSLLSRRQRILPPEPPTPVRSKRFDVPYWEFNARGLTPVTCRAV